MSQSYKPDQDITIYVYGGDNGRVFLCLYVFIVFQFFKSLLNVINLITAIDLYAQIDFIARIKCLL